jgi:hypothetical protein
VQETNTVTVGAGGAGGIRRYRFNWFLEKRIQFLMESHLLGGGGGMNDGDPQTENGLSGGSGGGAGSYESYW